MNVEFTMDDGRCLLDVINDPSALDQFLAPEDGQLPEDAFGLENLQPSITTTGPTLTSTSFLGATTSVSQHVSQTPSLNTAVTSNLGMTLGVPTTNITVVPGSSPQIFQQIQSSTNPVARDASPAPQLNQNVTQQQQQIIIQSQQNVQQIQNLQTGQLFGSPQQQQQLLRQAVLQQKTQSQQGTVKQVAIQPQTAVMTGNTAQNLGGIQIRPQGQVSSGSGQVQGTLIQTSSGNKLLIQGNALAGQQLNLAPLQGIQLQQNSVQLQQPQQQAGSATSVNQQTNMQQAKITTTSQNVNVLNLNQLNTQGQQQILIQRPVQGGPNQNIILKTIPGSNMLQIQQNANNSGNQANQTITLAGQQLVVAPQNQAQPQATQIQGQTPAQTQAQVLSGLPAGINIINNLQNVNVMAASQGQLVATPTTSTSSQKVQGPNVTLNINGQNMTIPLQQLQALQQLNKGVNIIGQQTQTHQSVQGTQAVAVAQPNMLGTAQVVQTQTGQQLLVSGGAVLKNTGSSSVQNTVVQNSHIVSSQTSATGDKVSSDPVAQKLKYEQALLIQKPQRQVQPLTTTAQLNVGTSRVVQNTAGQVMTSNFNQTAQNIIAQNQTLAQVQKLQLSTNTTAQTNQSGVGIVNQNTVQLQQSSVKVGTVHGTQNTVQWGQSHTQQQIGSNQIAGLQQSQNTNENMSRQLQSSVGSSSQGHTQFVNTAGTQPVLNQGEDKGLPSSAIQLTPNNQVLLQKIQQQLKTLQALPNRNEQQEKWLQQLSDAQRKLLIQGRVQAIKNHEQQKLLRQQKLQEKVVQGSKPHPQTPQQQVVQQVKPVNTPIQPNTSQIGMQANSASNNTTAMYNQQGQASSVQNIPQVQLKHHLDVNKQSGGTVQNMPSMQILQTAGQQNLNVLLGKQGKPAQVNLISSTSAVQNLNTQKITLNTTTSPSLNPGMAATGINSNASASPTGTSSNPAKALNQLQLPQAVKEKLQAQLAKMTPEQQKLFYKHQPLLLLKLQQQQQNLMQQKQQNLPSGSQSIPLTVQQVASSTSNQILKQTVTQSVAQPPASITTARLPVKRPAQPFNKVVFIQSQLTRDQNGALHPDCKTAFKNNKDACKRLLRYHVYQSRLPSDAEFETVDNMFEDVSQGLLDKKSEMLNKYQKLLLDDSQRKDPTAEMVMLERIFLNDERKQLQQDRDIVQTDPDSFTPYPIIKEETKPETSDQSDEETDTKKIKVEKDSESDSKEETSSHGSSKYTLHASGGLKIVIKNSPANSPADSPKPNNGVDIKTEVKSESQEVDEDQENEETKKTSKFTDGIKKEPVDPSISNRKHSRSSRQSNVSETSEDGSRLNEEFSETDAAVAGLMSSTGMSDSEMFSDLSQDESNLNYDLNSSKEDQEDLKELTHNDIDDISVSPVKKRKISRTTESDNSVVFSDNEHGTADPQGEIDSAVDGLLADLGPDPSPLSNVGDGDWPNHYEPDKCFNGDLEESSQSDTEIVHKMKGQGQSDPEETGSLQFEMESAINSILSLQQSTGGSGASQQKSDNNGLSYDETPIDQEDDLDAAIQSIL